MYENSQVIRAKYLNIVKACGFASEYEEFYNNGAIYEERSWVLRLKDDYRWHFIIDPTRDDNYVVNGWKVQASLDNASNDDVSDQIWFKVRRTIKGFDVQEISFEEYKSLNVEII